MADPTVQARLEANQFHDAGVDLSKPAIGTYGQYLNSLHIVMENAEGWHEVREAQLLAMRDIMIRAADKKQWRLSRIGYARRRASL